MKKITTHIIYIAILFFANILAAQTKLNKKSIYSGTYAEKKNIWNLNSDFIPYNNEVLLVNYDAISVLKMRLFTFGARPVLNKYSIDRVNPTTRKLQNIPILTDFKGLDIDYIDYLLKEDVVKLFFSYYNVKAKTEYVFCSETDLLTNKSKTSKIYEFKMKGDKIKSSYLKGIVNREQNTIAFVDYTNTGKVVFDYIIKDFDMATVDMGEKISAADIPDFDIKNFTLTKNGEIVFNTIKRVKRGFLKKSTYDNNVCVIKDRKLKTINTNVAKYFGNVILSKAPNGDPFIIMSYGETSNKFDGIYIASIDGANGELVNKNKITYDELEIKNGRKTERAQTRVERRDKRGAANTDNIITDVSVAPNGDIYILQEEKRIVTTTTRSTTGTGVTTTSTRTTYTYGPGIVHCIDSKTNEHKGLVKIEYRFNTNYDPGKGLRYIPSNFQKIWVEKYGEYYTYELDNTSKLYHTNTRESLKANTYGYKMLFTSAAKRKGSQIFTFPEKAYIVSKTTKKLEIGEVILK